jgi:cell division protein FtsB
MERVKNIWAMLVSAAMPALSLTIVAFFGGYALFGSNGVLAWGDYTHRLADRRIQLIKVEKARAELANRVALLDLRHADPDLADELIRKDLGLAHPDEIIIPLR